MATITKLPDGYFACTWCKSGLRYVTDEHGVRSFPSTCNFCKMNPHPSPIDETVGGKIDPTKKAGTIRSRTQAPRVVALNLQPLGKPVLGVDPGYRYTGVVIRDGDALLHASTFVRPDGMNDPTDWALTVRAKLRKFLNEYHATTGTILPIAVESVTAPKGFKGGVKAPINPGPILFAGVVLGVVLGTWPDAVVIQPGGNGSQHLTHYPPGLIGRRPPDLPGQTTPATTRDHEKSAYDVAGRAHKHIYPTHTDPALIEGMRR